MTVAVADFVVSTFDVTVTPTVVGSGTVTEAGAVYEASAARYRSQSAIANRPRNGLTRRSGYTSNSRRELLGSPNFKLADVGEIEIPTFEVMVTVAVTTSPLFS